MAKTQPPAGPGDYYLDINPVVRLVTGDPPRMAKAATELFERAARREFALHLTATVVAEAAFVLTSFYKVSRERSVEALLG